MNPVVINARFLTQSLTGVQRFAAEISLQLKQMAPNLFQFVSPANIVQQTLAIKLGVKIIGHHKGHVWEQLDLPKYLHSQGNPLLINLANTAPLFYKNKIVVIHDVAFKVFPKTFSKSFLYVYNIIIPQIIKTAKHIVTVSEFSKVEIEKCYPASKGKTSVIYNAVGEGFFECNEAKDNYFLAVSSINYRKNFIYILKAFKKFAKDYPNSELRIVGDIKCRNFGKIDISQYRHIPQIKFLGRVSDKELVGLYQKAKGFVYPSLYEGFGIPPLEAQKCGCPAICADASCLPEVFGDSVLYCDPYNEDTLVECFKRLSTDQDLCEQLVQKGFDNTKRYSWKKSGDKLYAIVNSLTNDEEFEHNSRCNK